MDDEYLTVSQVNAYLKNKLKKDVNLQNIYIRGEISNYKTYPSGHSYFTLKDKDSQIPAVMFKGRKYGLKFQPEDGMNVIIKGKIEVYERDGKYQLYANSMTEDGIGDLHIAFEQLKKKLEKEGLFDEAHKKEIPKYPQRIGVVTAQTGAAIKDIITTIERRYPYCKILVFSTLVQGDMAAGQIVRQIRHAQQYDIDTLIVGRGGGSIEDLWPFNEEIVAREIYACRIPVISAVGHQIDVTISDYVADKRAATPTAAAEIAVPETREVRYKISQLSQRVNKSINDKLTLNREKVENISQNQIFKNPESIYEIKEMHLDNMIGKLNLTSSNIISKNRNKLLKIESRAVLRNPEEVTKAKRETFLRNVDKLKILNPLLTLKRGYSIAKIDDKVISSAKDVKSGDELDIKFDDGTINTKVI
ncbi:MAG: exodeoxyribonuclease VII large subunit [Methanobrevibacter sp.]|uniref:exodeoxyribonuclease VII large subunit n=1 Tax=Methanobrevibacter sp. TaxID=66852 RepID=UPI0025F5718C|nr:exodeoxyribonuclease VII large subunit [Methanobrevibacter sp.]MBR6993190.1 exodeoxyribonuclease VII large subunit [Methanobrevibacter sp.]